MKNEMYELAKSYKDRGWSVLPCGKNKIPLISWKEYQTRIADDSEIYEWFEQFPEAQVGIVTGSLSNLSVVDVEEGGDPSFLPQNTMIVGTGGNGYHYYFTFEEDITNKARVKELVDIRSEGGYVVAPGSVSDKGHYKLLWDAPLLSFPKELFPEPVNIFQSPESGGSNWSNGKEFKTYQGYGVGQRNDEMTKYIGYVLSKIHPLNWDTEAWDIIAKANQSNVPPLSDKELLTSFNSIKGIRVRDHSLGRATGQDTPYNTLPQTLSGDLPTAKNTIDDEVRHISQVAEEQTLNQGEVYPLKMPCFDEAILGGVSVGDVVVIAGQTSQGKTTLAQDFTMAMVRGEKPAKALWFSYEVLVSHLWQKFQDMGMTKEDCAFIPAKHSTGNVAWIETKIKEGKEKFGIKSVFIDHLGFLLPKTNGILGMNLSSNMASFITQIMRDLKTIALQEEVIIFLPVHMKKIEHGRKQLDINDLKDSSGIGQEADIVFLIERERNRDEAIKTYFTERTIITLAKNRKTGMTVVANFFMLDGRFEYDNNQKKADKDFEDLGEPLKDEVKKVVKEVEVDNREVEQETLKDILEEEWDKSIKKENE